MDTTLMPAAEKFIRRMLRFGAGPKAGFRLKVAPGGCAGLAAEFDVEAEPKPDDVVWEHAGLRIFLDAKSRLSLNGVTVDFAETLSHTGFVFARQGGARQGGTLAACFPASALVPVDALVRR